MTFEEALDQLFNLGHSDDPDAMLASLKKRHGEEWLVGEMAKYADDKALVLIRGELRYRARVYEREAAESFVPPAKGEQFWAGRDIGWVEYAEVTEEFLLGRIAYYEQLEDALVRERERLEGFLALMRAYGVATLAEVPAGATLEAAAA